ncbi:MAG: ClpX C4-type zinc finger protein [Alphaproteobacteria bacterium]
MRKNRLPFRCSFCGKSELEVDDIVCGPAVFICNECVEAAADVLHEKKTARIKKHCKTGGVTNDGSKEARDIAQT